MSVPDIIEPWCAIGLATTTADDGLHCRDSPASSGRGIAVFPKGTELIVWGKQQAWYLVQLIAQETIVGWCHGDYLDTSRLEF